MNTFTIKGALKEARDIIKPKLWRVVGQYAWILALFMLLSTLSGNNLLLGVVVSSLFAFTTAIFSLGYARQGSFSLAEFSKVASLQLFAYFFLAFLVSKLLIVAGIFLLIVPGVIIGLCLCFVKFTAVEREIGPWEACKESARVTRGHRWQLLGFFIVIILVNIVGALCLLVGLFYTLPLTLIATALVYRKLKEAADFVPDIVEVVEDENGEIVDAEVKETEEAAAPEEA